MTGRRNDGFHLLDSLVTFADIGDTLTFSSSDSFDFTVSGPYSPSFDSADLLTSPASKNLVVRAAHALSAHFGVDLNVAIHLTKNLPLSSGIGGGSSNAATCLKGLVDFFQIDVTTNALLDIATSLGSDVPACLTAKPCRMEGIGEIITPLTTPLPPCPIVLVSPNRPCSTPTVFKTLKYNRPSASAPIYPVFDTPQTLSHFLNTQTRNDLTEAAVQTEPSIQDILHALNQSNGVLCARLSGSGATCFGLFATFADSITAQSEIKKNHPNWWVKSGWINKE